MACDFTDSSNALQLNGSFSCAGEQKAVLGTLVGRRLRGPSAGPCLSVFPRDTAAIDVDRGTVGSFVKWRRGANNGRRYLPTFDNVTHANRRTCWILRLQPIG